MGKKKIEEGEDRGRDHGVRRKKGKRKRNKSERRKRREYRSRKGKDEIHSKKLCVPMLKFSCVTSF